MVDRIDASVWAGLAVSMAYYFAVGAGGMGMLIWRYRERFSRWLSQSARDRADSLLNVCLFGLLINLAFQRAVMAYGFLTEERISPITLAIAPYYLVWSLVFTAGLLWWLCLEMFGPSRYHQWWWCFMVSGALLCVGVSWRF